MLLMEIQKHLINQAYYILPLISMKLIIIAFLFNEYIWLTPVKKESTQAWSKCLECFSMHGAEGGTRTPTGEPPLDPEPSVSANSTTSALFIILIHPHPRRKDGDRVSCCDIRIFNLY